MKVLDGNTFGTLLIDCFEKKSYRGVIVFENVDDVERCTKEIMHTNSVHPILGVQKIAYNNGITKISFQNNSIINFISLDVISHNSLGRRYHQILCSENIPGRMLASLVKMKMEYKDSSEVAVNRDNEENKALDDFLSGFKIKN